VAGRGRQAALPDHDYEPSVGLLLDEPGCLVRFTSEDGRATKDFEFARLPLDRPLQVAVALTFAQLTGPSGTPRSCIPPSGPTRIWDGSRSIWQTFLAHHADQVSWTPPTSPAMWSNAGSSPGSPVSSPRSDAHCSGGIP